MAKKAAKARKKPTHSKKSRAASRKKKPARKKAASRKATSRRTKTAARKRARSSARSKAPRKKTSSRSRTKPRVAARRTVPTAARPTRRRGPREAGTLLPFDPEESRGLGPESGGQSGDIEGLSRAEVADSESVEELAEEGQAFEAGIVDAVENAPEGEIYTREVPEDDVPEEYLDEK